RPPRYRALRSFFSSDTRTLSLYTLSLHDALPISQIKAQFLGFRLGTLPHLDEEGIALRLGDEADDVGSLCGASKEAGQRDARERYLEMLQRDHEFPPMKTNAGRPAYPTRAPSSHGPPSGAAKHQPARLSIIK